jgi:nucleoside-diphosphate-sugar epimerase
MHLVLGATGGFGGAMVRALLARGQSVRALVRDPAKARLPHGVEVVAGDAAQLTGLVAAAKGCDSIVHGLNLPYREWDPGMLALTENVVEASGLTGAAVVFPGNIYGLKPIYAVPLPPDAPQLDVNDRPIKKGRLRNQLEDHLSLNSETRNIRTLIVRAGDFYGPGVDNGLVGPMFRAALAGTPVPWFVDKAHGHAFTYVDDFAAVATELLLRTDRPRFEVANVGGDIYETAAAWAIALAKAAGKPRLDVQVRPRWQVRLLGLTNADAREFVELLYQWEGAILLDDRRTRQLLPTFAPTAPEESLARTLAWFRERG